MFPLAFGSSSICIRCSIFSDGGGGSSWRSRRSIPIPRMLRTRASSSFSNDSDLSSQSSSDIYSRSLRLLEWDRLCLSVASFAGTSLGRDAVKEELWYLSRSYEETLRLLEETTAAVKMHSYGHFMMDFSGINVSLVKYAVKHARMGFPVLGSESMALVHLLQFAESLQSSLKAAIKDDADWYERFMPLSEKSADLKKSRDQVRFLERKLNLLLESLISHEMKEVSSLEVSNVDGRWCIKSKADLPTNFDGLLLSSGSGAGNIMEPVSAIQLNDELQQAKAAEAKAETEVLLKISDKVLAEINDIEILFKLIIQLDVVNARATYSISYGGSYPEIFFPMDDSSSSSTELLSKEATPIIPHATQRKWTIYLPKAYHPLLLEQHRHSMQKAIKDVHNANAEIRRRRQQGGLLAQQEEQHASLSSLELQLSKLKQSSPVPVDIFIAKETRVLVVTGPNTGGKTICLKTVGLAAMMAKSGIYVLASEPVKIPWFDYVFADIGDGQSLSQSLSTFSGHLEQIGNIRAHSSSRSLVLLDEIGAGTNPLEGAALGMSLLESFAEARSLLTIATTHHGELKTLKYSNNAFENACMEYDEASLKPTYRILWGVPGRSNAINIAERLGLPEEILQSARELYGAASEEINEVIVDMEKFKQDFHEYVHEAQRYLMLSRGLYNNLLTIKRNVAEHGIDQRYRKMKEISEAAAIARSVLHKKVRLFRASSTRAPKSTTADNNQKRPGSPGQQNVSSAKVAAATKTANSDIVNPPSSDSYPLENIIEKRAKDPDIGDVVHISSLNKKATVMKVDPSKGEIVVQAGNMKLKVKIADVIP